MVTVKNKAVVNISKSGSERVYYTLDGTEPTTSSPEWTEGLIESYGNVILKTLTVSGTGESFYKSFPAVYVLLPESPQSSQITTTDTGFHFQLSSEFSVYSNLSVNVYTTTGTFISNTPISDITDVNVPIDSMGVYLLEVVTGHNLPNTRITSPTIVFYCQEPTISYEILDSEDGQSTYSKVTITQNGQGTTYYTTDGSSPDINGIEYSAPFDIYTSCEVKAITKRNGWYSSQIVPQVVPVTRQIYEVIGSSEFILGFGDTIIGRRITEEL